MSEASGGRAAKGANSERRGGAPDDAVAVTTAKLCSGRGGARNVRRRAGGARASKLVVVGELTDVCIRLTPSSASRIGYGEQTVSRNRDGRGRAMRAGGRNAHGTRCSRRTSKCISSHSTVTPSTLANGSAAVVCQSDGERRIRLLSVSCEKGQKRHAVSSGLALGTRGGLRQRRKNAPGYGYLRSRTRGEQRAGLDDAWRACVQGVGIVLWP